ncbi:hypothetical protein [Cupriavidus metallidurans]|uniref:hypothetical protein n=1 Tax=Cupriavidus metallidurans TaxID=119219 RepID=UPI00131A28AF|nr:hypothetical protein [Cupriavidus metallidurans]
MARRMKRAMMLGLFAAMASAHAGGTATVVCGRPGDAFGFGAVPVLQVSYNTGSDTGTPGLFWFGIISQDQTLGSVLTPQGWQDYTGGLYPFQARYDNALPQRITLSIPFPGGVQTTAAYVGYSVYAGHGAYAYANRQKVADRRTALNNVKPDMVAKGRWRPEFDSDDYYIWALIQKDMVDNNKYGPILAIPYVDCTPPMEGGG